MHKVSRLPDAPQRSRLQYIDMPSRSSIKSLECLAAGAIAVLLTTMAGFALRMFFFEQMVDLAIWLYGGPGPSSWNTDPTFVMIITCVFGVPLYVLAIGLFTLIQKSTLTKTAGDETRCRCCNAVLRHLTEPKCPVCNEPI